MIAIFAGLSRFAHLINVDFFTDLFECLKRIIKEEPLNLSDSLNCVSTIFTILSGFVIVLIIVLNLHLKFGFGKNG